LIRGLIAGSLARQPEERQSKVGKPYTLASIREGSGDKARWISAFLFSDETRGAVAGMTAGEAIAIAGEIDAEVYVPEGGQPRVSWSVKVDAVLSANTGARKRNAAEPEQPREERDEIPF
jgi:hypothetical protein